MMTQLLEKAFREASKLPENDQNIMVKWLLDELTSERKWKKAFAESEDILDHYCPDNISMISYSYMN